MDNPKLSGFIAHSVNSMGQTESLEEHLGEVARRSQNAAQKYRFQEASSLASWLGWWHDAGKVYPDVQAFLHQPTKAHGPDHSSVGALQAWKARSPLAFCVAGHHGGLMDSDDLRQRMLRKEKEQRIQEALIRARQLLPPEMTALPSFPSFPQERQQVRRCAFFIRMLHSALVDSDCLDTERHFAPEFAGARQQYPSLPTLWGRFEAYMQQLLEYAATP